MTDKTQQTNAPIEPEELRDLDVPEQDAEGVKGGMSDRGPDGDAARIKMQMGIDAYS